VIEYVLQGLTENARELWEFLVANYDPLWTTLDLAIVTFGIYWLLVLIRGTRAVQVLVGFGALIGLRLFSDFLGLETSSWIFDNFFGSLVLIIVILFADDIRTALARMGRGFTLRMSEQQESALLEEVVRACQSLAQRRIGALIVFQRETRLDDRIEAGSVVDAELTKDLLSAIFMPTSPLHDGAVLIQQGRLSRAGCILPLTLRTDLPEGLGTRHRAAVGITEQTDAVVVVVSEETGSISAVMNGELRRDLDAPELRVVLRDYLTRGPGEEEEPELPDEAEQPADDAEGTAELPPKTAPEPEAGH
jgi:diadenylate cyclase